MRVKVVETEKQAHRFAARFREAGVELDIEPMVADSTPASAPRVHNELDDGQRLDAGDDAQPAAAASAGLDLDGEDPLQPLRPAERIENQEDLG